MYALSGAASMAEGGECVRPRAYKPKRASTWLFKEKFANPCPGPCFSHLGGGGEGKVAGLC